MSQTYMFKLRRVRPLDIREGLVSLQDTIRYQTVQLSHRQPAVHHHDDAQDSPRPNIGPSRDAQGTGGRKQVFRIAP